MTATTSSLPVIVAGEAWARGKGFTIDVDSPSAYHEALARLPLARLSADQQDLAISADAVRFTIASIAGEGQRTKAASVAKSFVSPCVNAMPA